MLQRQKNATLLRRRVALESPYKGKNTFERWLNRRYARKCLKHSLECGEAPFASHLLYTQVLNETNERTTGMAAGYAWTASAELMAIYVDRGVSEGMRLAIARAKSDGIPIEYRSLYRRPSAWHACES